jgi:ABC-type Fe3+/spermidine/putrescine transport system ATPase subunit
MTPLLTLNNVQKKGPGDFVLNDITFSQGRLEKVAIAGETGAGKSTVLKIIAGLVQPENGELLFEKQKIAGPADQLVPGHPGIAYLSQHFELQKSLRVEQVLAYSNRLSDVEADRLYAVCQIDHLLKRRTDELSGGEKQRVAICRLLISSPRLLLLDEPFSHLDMVHKNTLKSVIRDIGEKLRITCMLVSHDPQDTLSWADKIIIMKDGRILQQGSAAIVYNKPVDEYAAGLFGKYNLITRSEFRTFSRLRPLKKIMDQARGRNIFIRPEQLRIVRKSDAALRGRVEKLLFFGNYREAEITVAKKRFTVQVNGDQLREGQTVYINVSRGEFWIL